MSLLNTCDECYEVELPACPDTIYIYTDSLDVNEDFFTEFTDKFGNRYRLNPANANYGGVIAIDLSSLQDGLFTEFSGTWELRFYTDDECEELKELVFCDEVYECISITFYKIVTANKEAIICCEPPIPYP